ncbi:hypothetical protein [Streptomyces ipomoeae]|uniref:hypothetical protein n=1 Tax=Streptomyces ipomoeae TaxID=103232 RepID=UPI001146BB0A|nr:hypothetical protein [Streptomyces ipomoeae]MDX2938316.1 hypothetical protein [Streptomyces ipomoeae]TQE24732.1 hypothetical protein SipoB123_17675 [Streptomyces ipomoeae]
MDGKKCEHPPSEPSRETETAKEEKPDPTRETETVKDEKKGLNWAAGSFALNLWRTVRDWLNDSE